MTATRQSSTQRPDSLHMEANGLRRALWRASSIRLRWANNSADAYESSLTGSPTASSFRFSSLGGGSTATNSYGHRVSRRSRAKNPPLSEWRLCPDDLSAKGPLLLEADVQMSARRRGERQGMAAPARSNRWSPLRQVVAEGSISIQRRHSASSNPQAPRKTTNARATITQRPNRAKTVVVD